MNTTISKRIKSFLIALGSVAASALFVVLASPQFIGLTSDLYGYLRTIGVPASVVAVLGLFVSEIVRDYLNRRQIAKASELGGHSFAATKSFDLY